MSGRGHGVDYLTGNHDSLCARRLERPGERRALRQLDPVAIGIAHHRNPRRSAECHRRAFRLAAVRQQWQRVTLMQTNREDVNTRYREIRIPRPRDVAWVADKEAAFREYFTTLAKAKERFVDSLTSSGLQFIASARQVGVKEPDISTEEDQDQGSSQESTSSRKKGRLRPHRGR